MMPVLVVDDEIGLLNLFAGLIERMDYETVRANSGQAALDYLAHTIPELMVLDLAMPGISGIDVLRYVQADPELDPMKIIVLTALAYTSDMEEVAGRVDMWLNRPILPAEFMTAVRQVMEGDF